MVSYVLTKLVDEICNDNLDVKMLLVVDVYYNKEAEYLECPWEVNKETEMEGSIANSDRESADGNQEENEGSIVGNQNSLAKESTEAPQTRENDQALDNRPDIMPELNLGEPEEK